MIRQIVVLLAAITLVAACKADDATTKGETPEVTETTGAVPAPSEDPVPAEEPANEAAEGTFGGLVDGATIVTVTQRQADQDADYGGKARVASDAEWIANFVAAIGPDKPGSEAVPKCLPTYTLVFATAEGELATFGGVCAGADTVVLVRDGASYSATDSVAARKMLQELAVAEPVKTPAQ